MTTRGEMMQAKVLSVLHRCGDPLSAYDVLKELRAQRPKLAPTTIYRALSGLIERGRVRRLESLNAYIACQARDHQPAPVLSICDTCGTVEERAAPNLLAKLSDILEESGFAPQHHVIEVHGICADCSSNAAPTVHSTPG